MSAPRAAVAAVLLWAVAAPAQPVHVVAPNIYTDTRGPGLNSSFLRTQNFPWAAQVIYNANQLSGLVGTEITGVTYRLGNVLPNPFPFTATTWADYRIQLGPAVAPALATGTYAANYTQPPTLVRSGPLSVPAGAWPLDPGNPGGPAPWGLELTFDQPYLYTGGHLAMYVTHMGCTLTLEGNNLLEASGSASPGLHVDYTSFNGAGYLSTTGTLSNFTNVVRFTAQPAAVPEPATWVLTSLGSLGLLAARRRTTSRTHGGVP